MFGVPVRHYARYNEILSVLIRHGLGYIFITGTLIPMQEKDLSIVGVHLRSAFEELGPAFIKIGQIASTRSEFFPQAIVQELAKLQDRVRPLPFEQIRWVIEESLQSRMELTYREFNPLPIAAASIGQVHQAVLINGESVAVKVQRPFLEERIKTDLEIFQILVNQIERRTEWGKRYPLRKLIEEFSDTIRKELDYVNEGRNAEKLASLYKRNSNILIPRIYWKATSSTVLTMEYILGISLHQIIGSIETSYNVHRIAERLSNELLRQILLEGCFHADPHPGNILILPGEKIAFIDFGITGNLTPPARAQILSLTTAIIRGKESQVLKTLSQMGIIPDHIDRQAFQTDISALRSKHLKGFFRHVAIGQSIQEFFDIVFRHGIYIPSEFILVGKSLITLEGVLNELDPTLSLVEQAKPFSRRYICMIFSLKDLFSRILGN